MQARTVLLSVMLSVPATNAFAHSLAAVAPPLRAARAGVNMLAAPEVFQPDTINAALDTTSLVADKFVDDLLAIGPLGYMVSGGALIVSALVATQLVRSFVTNVVPVVLQFGLFIAVFEFFGVIPPL